ncbi:AbrB/MazE/SpoVT family DNA-binding domain-containing protein [Sphingomonas sp. RS2018]
MQVAKWGNSLAVRIPADVARTLGLKEGDDIDICALDSGQVAVLTRQQIRLAAIERMRTMAQPLPANYRFDREEANAR